MEQITQSPGSPACHKSPVDAGQDTRKRTPTSVPVQNKEASGLAGYPLDWYPADNGKLEQTRLSNRAAVPAILAGTYLAGTEVVSRGPSVE